jgi:beta-lactamase class A
MPPAVQTAPTNIQQNNFSPAINDLKMFDRTDLFDGAKAFLLRQLIKNEVQTNEDQQILTDVSIVDLQKDQTIYGHNESTPHFAASINKLPVTMLVLEELRANRVTLDTVLTWTETDRRAGNGIYDLPGSPTSATIRDVLHDLLNRSGNTAVRALVNDVLGGAVATNDRLALVPQIPHTRLIPLDGNRFYLGDTTSNESLFIMRKVLENQDQYGQYVKELMRTNIFVGDGVRSQLAGNDYIVLVNKTGLLYDPDGNNTHDVGIIYNTRTHKSYGYSILTTAPYTSDTATVRADQSIKNMGKYLLRFAGDRVHNDAEQLAPKTLVAPQTTPETKILY